MSGTYLGPASRTMSRDIRRVEMDLTGGSGEVIPITPPTFLAGKPMGLLLALTHSGGSTHNPEQADCNLAIVGVYPPDGAAGYVTFSSIDKLGAATSTSPQFAVEDLKDMSDPAADGLPIFVGAQGEGLSMLASVTGKYTVFVEAQWPFGGIDG